MRLDWLKIIELELEEGRSSALATVVAVEGTELSQPGEQLLMLEDETLHGDLGSPELGLRLAAAFRQARGASGYYEIVLPVEEPTPGEVRVYVEVYEPRPEVLIIGGGHVGKCVAHLAHFTGLAVSVADDRAAFASLERFPMARRVHCGPLPELLPALPTHRLTYVVICTRGHAYDELAVAEMLRKPHAYVGLLGSKRKALEIYKNLERSGFERGQLQTVHTPIGLPIGAETPEEIALSILAEILSLARSKDRYKVQRVRA